ncbi:hypothetical protein EHQ53_14340 [Leptospira langatensis]|uniref:Lipoprotein n=1 Tax=Leptospira langatensis TaxID=2484983 RepID=A0ABY2M956_9LEPT|nr:hypothetical protein EHQ53_14340 [Leptospira langatensis]
MNTLKNLHISFITICSISICLSLSCNEGRPDCSHATASDRKISEPLEMACLADKKNSDFCDLYVLEMFYHSHCW